MPRRFFSLDLLRTVAVLLVLGRHLPSLPVLDVHASTFMLALHMWRRVGWMGVDLFFVLSGFLVSGLLFREYIRHGSVRIGRFLVRRGLKIYPSFYVFLAVTFLVDRVAGTRRTRVEVLAQLVFLQNYLPNFLPHTWSLAVEEHFYLLLSLLVLVMSSRRGYDPFRLLAPIIAATAIVLLMLRYWTVVTVLPYKTETHLFPTHLRIDSLFVGVLLSWIYHFHPERFQRLFLGRFRLPILVCSVLMVLPPVVLTLGHSMFLETAGLSLLYLGFGGIAATTIDVEPANFHFLRPVATVGAAVGANSYSMYLWHVQARDWLLAGWQRAFGAQPPLALSTPAYIIATVVFGVLMARMVELPALHMRDRLFPSRSGATPEPPSPATSVP